MEKGFTYILTNKMLPFYMLEQPKILKIELIVIEMEQEQFLQKNIMLQF